MIRNLIATLLAAVLSLAALNALAAADANQASRADLETVKGIGPGLSGKIVEARKAGGFKNWSDMVDRVSGVGQGNAAKLSQGGLTVAGAAYDGQAAAPAKAAKTGGARRSKKADATGKTGA